jgi:hypothetical protein
MTTSVHRLERQGSSIKLADKKEEDTKTLVAMFVFYFCLFVSTTRKNSTAVTENGPLRTSLLVSCSFVREVDKIFCRMLTGKLLDQREKTL